jgi:FkbH-like protein
VKLKDALTLLRAEPADPPIALHAALVCGCTPLHLQTFLHAHLRVRFPERGVRIQTGIYGDALGTLRKLKGSAPEAIAVVLEWPDLDPRLGIRRLGGWRPSDLPDIARTVRRQGGDLLSACQALAAETVVVLCLPTLGIPPAAYQPGWQLSEFEAELDAIAAELALEAARTAGIRIVNPRRLAVISPPAARFDPKSELAAGFPYRLEHASAVAELLAQLVGPPPPKKGIITDLDGTLWQGILGEAGVDGVAWDLEHHAQGHALYQQLLASLEATGVLVAVASKNDAALVEEAFRRPDGLLKREQVFPVEVHWGAKSHSVGRILEAWNIGADAVVFVDDDPMQLAEVAAAHPGIEGVLFPSDEEGLYALLSRLRDLFGRSVLTDEDRLRVESLRRTRGRASDESEGAEALPVGDEFLAEAGAKVRIDTAKEPFDMRAFELLNKTNQFNLNGRRVTEGAWRAYLREPDTLLLVASYGDKFGALGKIAVLSGLRRNGKLQIDHWVMSCRAFSRRVEHQCLRFLFERCGIEDLTFGFEETARNGPLRTFLQEISGAAPAPGMVLTRATFAARCPSLFHEVESSDRA